MEMRASGGSTLNSGVFDSGVAVPGTDYTLQDTSQANGTDLVSANGTNATPSVTSVGYSFTAADEGNSIVISSGTNFTVSVYIITNTSGGAAILDKACGSADVLAGGTWRMGGAYPWGNITAGISDDARMELMQPGNTVWVKAGTYTGVGAVSISTAGNAAGNINFFGYNATRGDDPTGDNRPLFAMAGLTFNFTTFWQLANFRVTTTAASGLASGNKAWNIKSVNSSTTAARAAMTQSTILMNCELVSYLGPAISIGSTNSLTKNCYIHDSNIGISSTCTGTPRHTIVGNIFENLLSQAYNNTGAANSGTNITNNIFYGAENKLGVALNFPTASTFNYLDNNIIYGYVTGVVHADTQTSGLDDFNDYFNNTADVSAAGQWQKGDNDIAVNPSFTNVTQMTGTGATSATNVLTDGAANFGSVVDNETVVNLTSGSGTGFRTGLYVVTAHTTTTLTLSPGNITSSGSGSSIAYQITLGHNFLPTGSISGFPGPFQAALTTGYLTIGAVQKQATAGGSGGFFIQ